MAILIVDDSADMRRVSTAILKQAGHPDAVAVELAREAFSILGLNGAATPSWEFDLILMDITLPDIDGIEACRRIKAEPRLADIPILMITASAEDAALQDAFAAGAADYIQKPYKPVVLVARVENALHLKREMDARKQREAELLTARAELEVANEELRELVDIDGLTKIGNRRSFDEYLDREWRRARREERPLALIMADIDHFKLYNDTYGHPGGDECLKQVAAAFRGAIRRPADRVFRYGGEEMVVLMPYTDAPGAALVAEKMQAALAALQLQHETSPVSPHVTASLGAASMRPAADSGANELVASADQALYRAKREGRNTFRVAE